MAALPDTFSNIGNTQRREDQPDDVLKGLTRLFKSDDLDTIPQVAWPRPAPYDMNFAKAGPISAGSGRHWALSAALQKCIRERLEFEPAMTDTAFEFPSPAIQNRATGQPTAELDQLATRVMHENWDGTGAPALASETINHASALLGKLPASVQAPDVEATVQGEIIFSWDSKDLGDSFDVAMQPDGQMVMAGVFDGVIVKGTVNPKKGKTLGRLADLIRWTMQ